ncbi:MAG: polyprenyl synthetase family protein [Candidatus Altiarchaeales archaeon]|nr:polyprenyl synthetase family protein [Candidatus Altiarchaeales archaeon]
MRDFNKTLDEYGIEIENELEGFFKKKIKEAEEYHGFMGDIYAALGDYVLRKGKRLASCSTLLVYKGYGQDIDKKILGACAGIELYRHGILIHDDLVDMDDLRRGGKAFHRIFRETSERFGEGVSVFSGNILYSLSLETVLNSSFSRDRVNEVISLINSDYSAVNESQILDLLFEHKEPDVEQWYQMASKRAASLFRTTMLSGAILAGAGENENRILREIASNIGYAFDIQDDIIGTFATEEEYGRPPTGDILSGKKPLHVVCALQSAPAEDVRKLREVLGGKGIKEEDIVDAKEILERYGLEQAKKRSREHARKAIGLINETEMSKETKEFFIGFINYITESLKWYK